MSMYYPEDSYTHGGEGIALDETEFAAVIIQRDNLRAALRKLLIASRNVDYYLDDCDGFQNDFQVAIDEAATILTIGVPE